MSDKLHMVFIHECTPKGDGRIFTYPLDSGKTFDYRARVSSNAFFFGKGRNVKEGWVKRDNGPRYPKPGSTMYGLHHEIDFTLKYYVEEKGIKPIEVANIWEFYKAIGYDYKKQKWV